VGGEGKSRRGEHKFLVGKKDSVAPQTQTPPKPHHDSVGTGKTELELHQKKEGERRERGF